MDGRLGLPVNTVLDGTYRITRVVGSGGFGITYEAEDINLRTVVALKEYYPAEFGDRDATMSVRPRSERHKKTFDWGRSNFLQEARTLARFEHPSIVQVMRVFEAHSTAYMVMRFEQGQSFDDWLRGLGRPPTQEELDAIIAPLLGALEVMHAADFLHRDIAPDNIIVRTDGSPVLLDFGAARRAVAVMSRAMTGIVKAGYSPHEQYSTDSRLQGPWSDIYALGGTLYRAVTGSPPEEATLRVGEDRMAPASLAANGTFRPGFLAAIDACLKVRHAERPRSIARLRDMMLPPTPQPVREAERVPTRPRAPSKPMPTRQVAAPRQRMVSRQWLAIGAAGVALLGGIYGGFEFTRWQPGTSSMAVVENDRVAGETEASRAAAINAARQQADLDAARQRREAAQAAERQASLDAELRRKEQADAAQRQAELEAERQRKEEAERIAAEDTARRSAEAEAEARRKQEEQVRVAAATLNADERATFVKRVQAVLKQGRCYDGAINGRSSDAQDDLERFVANANRKGKGQPPRIELAKATANDFEAWLSETGGIKGDVCAPPKAAPPKVKPPRPEQVRAQRHQQQERTERRARAERPERAERSERESSSSSGGGLKLCAAGGRQMAVCP